MTSSPQKKILIIDDDPQIRMLLKDRLEANDYAVIQAENSVTGLELTKTDPPDLLLLDLQMPEMDGMEVLQHIRQQALDVPVVIMTAFGSIERAMDALKLGAYDFLPKPCKPDHIMMVVKNAIERKEMQEQNQYLRQEIERQYHMVIGESDAMRHVMDLARSVAPSKTTVLIGGESGTGKQLMARSIHAMSDRRDKPFVQVNCTTLSEQLIESDLFGHEKGAFTGAIKRKKGRFELANKGTMFLDEIGDLPLSLQAKLLHVIEYGEFQRVGGTDTLTADVRFIAATNKDLQKEVRENRFREDLYYRLNVVTVQLPALRTRMNDIPLFADHFLKKHSKAMQKNVIRLAPATIEQLKKYSWPGNIRELENAIERAVVLSYGSEITPNLLPQLSDASEKDRINIGLPLDEAMVHFKKEFITRTLQSVDNNQSKAAKLLNIQRTYLNRLIKELGVTI
ncbi:sigma-54-dependent Fis family transcriptional regulator [candidate division KSB1 bacterium]|nr:sigma-54-dependent Fis family transcriptional regulator [candidate division KSB1 bacterium]